MPGVSPQETADLIHAAINAGDHSAVMECFDDDIVYVALGGADEARGKKAAGDVMAAFLGLRPKIDARPTRCVIASDLALLVTEWTLEATEPDGTRSRSSGRTADVLRRGTDGMWRYVIDNPAGVD